MYLFRNYIYICSRLKLNLSPMHQINHGQVSLLLQVKTTKPGRWCHVLGDKCLSSDNVMFGALSGARCQALGVRH